MPARHHIRIPLFLSILTAAALLLSACGARNFSSAPSAGDNERAMMQQAAPAADFYGEAEAVASVPDGSQQSSGASTNALLNRKMIARASLAMVVSDTAETIKSVEALMAELGGFIAMENFYNQSTGDQPMLGGTMTLRVPAESLATAMERLQAMALEVGNHSITREDVTDQYVDLDAQLRNLTATEDELREMLAEVRAKPNATPEDILAVHNRLTEIRGQIEQVQGRKNMLDNLIGLSTIELSLVPDASLLPVVEEGWRPLTVVRDAARALVGALQGLGNFAIWFVIYLLPILLIVAIPFALLLLLLRWLIRRRRVAVTPAGIAES